ncbi:hypothetical protein [Saccharopolyspora phatthalungensis]|uniref:Uncharacterized protein n=1 Tax=Saccharopolyspora phatthalungensis TaxID=664693 RepID=A0A840QFT6_9PSEU|nr:hypothetical protein [Saccharopolyspora phatthalungensis]MBB5158941.1 hypothetical protein [Saccharopolyspora phatthalungensis]
MSAHAVTPVEIPADAVAEIGELPRTASRIRRNRFGQWCTRDAYGTWTPHCGYDAALRVVDGDEVC